MPYCIICGKEFIGRSSQQKTCSKPCSLKLEKINHLKVCKAYYYRNLQKRREVSKKYSETHKEYLSNYKKERLKKFKRLVFQHYGEQCACCGESHIDFLTIDHIKGNGNKHRKNMGSSNILDYLVKNNYPEEFQTLCMNCNFAKDIQDKPFCKVHHPELYESQP